MGNSRIKSLIEQCERLLNQPQNKSPQYDAQLIGLQGLKRAIETLTKSTKIGNLVRISDPKELEVAEATNDVEEYLPGLQKIREMLTAYHSFLQLPSEDSRAFKNVCDKGTEAIRLLSKDLTEYKRIAQFDERVASLFLAVIAKVAVWLKSVVVFFAKLLKAESVDKLVAGLKQSQSDFDACYSTAVQGKEDSKALMQFSEAMQTMQKSLVNPQSVSKGRFFSNESQQDDKKKDASTKMRSKHH